MEIAVAAMSWNLPLGAGAALLATALYFVASLLQGSVGFGSAILSAPFLVLIHPRFVPAPIAMSSMTIAALVLVREVRFVRARRVLLLIAGRFVGAGCGVLLLQALSQRGLVLTFAILLLVAVGMSAAAFRVPITTGTSLGAGVVSGVMGTVAGIGGVAAALLYQNESPKLLRANLAAFLVFGNAISVAMIAAAGRVTVVELKLYLTLLPGLATGYFVSRWFQPKTSKRVVKPIILVVAGAAAVWLIVQYFAGS